MGLELCGEKNKKKNPRRLEKITLIITLFNDAKMAKRLKRLEELKRDYSSRGKQSRSSLEHPWVVENLICRNSLCWINSEHSSQKIFGIIRKVGIVRRRIEGSVDDIMLSQCRFIKRRMLTKYSENKCQKRKMSQLDSGLT